MNQTRPFLCEALILLLCEALILQVIMPLHEIVLWPRETSIKKICKVFMIFETFLKIWFSKMFKRYGLKHLLFDTKTIKYDSGLMPLFNTSMMDIIN